MHLSGIHQVNHRLAVPLAYFFGGFGIWGQMDIQAALGKQSLDLDGGGKPLGCSVVQRLRWFSHGEFHIHLNGVALVGPDFCPVLAAQPWVSNLIPITSGLCRRIKLIYLLILVRSGVVSLMLPSAFSN